MSMGARNVAAAARGRGRRPGSCRCRPSAPTPTRPSKYARTKAEGEAAVREIYPDAVVVRPSVVFGPDDSFFNRFAAMAQTSARCCR